MALDRLTSYGSESWTVRTNERQLISTEMCFFTTMRYTLWNHKRNRDVMKELQIPQVTDFIWHAIAQAVSCQWPGFEPRSGHVGYVVDKVALGQVFSEYSSFPCQFLFYQLLHTHHPGLVQ
jgi:hypothetical protein